jgi:major membrane immunogen (membrane-anchored lipoprotein)
MTVKQGDRVSLTTDKYGFVTGEFVGTKKVQAEGYTEILIIKFKDGKILQAPLEYIRKDSIMVYER